ncbi:MAG: zeta toxin family protein [Bacteroidales bacterium]|nr:zeta toxin family protein [Bacteroidales bacterium]
MPNLYVIAGCNGAGKTTASYTVLPEILDCEEFINADEIARGLSPFNPEKAAIEAGRIMLKKISDFIKRNYDFAFETTLASKNYLKTIDRAKNNGYEITLLFFWLDSVELAVERVKSRVAEGGRNIPEKVIRRRYFSGIKNLFELYIPVCDYWMITDNSNPNLRLVAEGTQKEIIKIEDNSIFNLMKRLSHGQK